jgi:hypothetical protein
MQKITRPAMHKPVRHVARKPARLVPAAPATRPVIARVEGDVDLTAPKGFRARVLLKLVDRIDGRRVYAWWAMAGRHELDAAALRFKYSGEDMLQFDLPEAMALSEELLTPFLKDFLDSEGNEPPDPPVIKR